MDAGSDAAEMPVRSAAPKQRTVWTAYGAYTACAWALIFAAVSFYWAAGGTVGANTIGPALTSLALARDPGFVAILWITGVLKVLAGLLALALVGTWGALIPRRLRWLPPLAGWGTGIALILYGGASFVQHALMVAGAIGIPAGLGATAARWHLLLWDPWWLLGGILFTLATWHFGRKTSRRQRSSE